MKSNYLSVFSPLAWMLAGLVLMPLPAAHAAEALPQMKVYKSPTCGCCGNWSHKMEQAGFSLEVLNRSSLDEIKQQQDIKPALRACHTALVGNFVIEGHVPAEDIVRLLKTRPKGIRGLVVPGMPMGAPGMEMGRGAMPFTVLALHEDGSTSVFAKHGKK